MTVSVVIPHYNTWELVKRNIDALLRFDKTEILEVIIVDDASPNKNPYTYDPIVKIVQNSENYHYSKTVNVGIAQTSGDIVIILNSDAYSTGPFVQKVIEHFKDPKVGCVGFKTVDEVGNDTGNVANEPSALSLVVGQQIHKKLKPFDFRRKKYLIPFSCAVAFRRTPIQTAGLFDDKNFPILMADYDLCISVNKLGYSTIYDKSILIYHKGGVSIPRNHKRVILFYNARWAFLKKHNLLRQEKALLALIRLRFKMEYMWLLLAKRFDASYKEKAKGRKEILEAINQLR